MIQDIAEQWLTQGARGDLSLVDQIFSPNLRINGVMVGRDGPRRNVTNRLTGFPDFDVSIDEQLVSLNRVATRMTWTGTHTGIYSGLAPTGRTVSVRALTIFHFQEDIVVETWTVIDQFELFRQLGALPQELLAAQLPAQASSD